MRSLCVSILNQEAKWLVWKKDACLCLKWAKCCLSLITFEFSVIGPLFCFNLIARSWKHFVARIFFLHTTGPSNKTIQVRMPTNFLENKFENFFANKQMPLHGLRAHDLSHNYCYFLAYCWVDAWITKRFNKNKECALMPHFFKIILQKWIVPVTLFWIY